MNRRFGNPTSFSVGNCFSDGRFHEILCFVHGFTEREPPSRSRNTILKGSHFFILLDSVWKPTTAVTSITCRLRSGSECGILEILDKLAPAHGLCSRRVSKNELGKRFDSSTISKARASFCLLCSAGKPRLTTSLQFWGTLTKQLSRKESAREGCRIGRTSTASTLSAGLL